MLEMILYFLLSYFTVAVISHTVLVSMTVNRPQYARSKRIKLAVVLLLFLLPLIPYGLVEGYTLLYSASLVPATRHALRESGYVDHICSMKVLHITPWRSKVYVVTPCLESKSSFRACVVELGRKDNKWMYQDGSEDIIWSDSGSADGNIFPPYPKYE